MSTAFNRRRGAKANAPRKPRRCKLNGCQRYVTDSTSQRCTDHRVTS